MKQKSPFLRIEKKRAFTIWTSRFTSFTTKKFFGKTLQAGLLTGGSFYLLRLPLIENMRVENSPRRRKEHRGKNRRWETGKCEVEKLTFTISLLLILLFFSAIFTHSAVSEPFSKIGSATFVTDYSGGTVPFTPNFWHKELRINYRQKLVGVGISFKSR